MVLLESEERAAGRGAPALARHLGSWGACAPTGRSPFLYEPDAEAIADMALDNYVEMRSGVVDADHVARRRLALELERRHPGHLSPRYNMVMGSTMPYAEARDRAAAQHEILGRGVADPALDLDALVAELPPLPDLDPLARPDALSLV